MDHTTLGDWVSIVLIAATVTTGLLAGLYFAFSCAVMPGLAAASDTALVESMQRINEKIINGRFIPVFVGGVVLPIAAAIMVAIDGETGVLLWTVAAAVWRRSWMRMSGSPSRSAAILNRLASVRWT